MRSALRLVGLVASHVSLPTVQVLLPSCCHKDHEGAPPGLWLATFAVCGFVAALSAEHPGPMGTAVGMLSSSKGGGMSRSWSSGPCIAHWTGRPSIPSVASLRRPGLGLALDAA